MLYVRFATDTAFVDASAKFASAEVRPLAENRTLEFYAVPLEFRGNSRRFDPVSAVFISETTAITNRSISPIVLAHSVFPDSAAPSFEAWAAAAAPIFGPAGFIAHSGTFGPGGYQVNRVFEDKITEGIKVPIVHMSATSAQVLFSLLNASGGALNVTITDWPPNPYMERYNGGVFIFYSVLLCAWALVIIVLASVTLALRGVARNLGTLCLILDVTGACVRFVWGLDPFAGRFIPVGILETLYTGSLPIVLSGTIILLLFWHELATQVSLSVSGVLDKKTKPAVISICILFVAEMISASIRSSRVRSNRKKPSFVTLVSHRMSWISPCSFYSAMSF